MATGLALTSEQPLPHRQLQPMAIIAVSGAPKAERQMRLCKRHRWERASSGLPHVFTPLRSCICSIRTQQ